MIAIVMLLGSLAFFAAAYHNEDQELPLLAMAAACLIAGVADLLA